MAMQDLYFLPDLKKWQGRVDSNHPDERRWHQIIQRLDLESLDQANHLPSWALVGFSSDEGVRRNRGRIGAKKGPDAFRVAASNLPYTGKFALYDGGDIVCNNHDLEAAQEALTEAVYSLHKGGYIPLLIGGGHEIAFPHFSGIQKCFEGTNIGVINFDAHYDLRSKVGGLGNSGTSFCEIHELCRNNKIEFQYCVVGIQKYSNTQLLFNRADDWGVRTITADSIADNFRQSISQLKTFIDTVSHLYVTICLDVFHCSVAPGVSAPSVTGLQWEIFIRLLKQVFVSGKVVSMDIAELNPTFDIDNQTSKLAAAIAFEMIRMKA